MTLQRDTVGLSAGLGSTVPFSLKKIRLPRWVSAQSEHDVTDNILSHGRAATTNSS